MRRTSLLIVGAGPYGLATAAYARQRGLDVLPAELKRIAKLPAAKGHRRNPEWRRKAKQSEASLLMRSRPSSATSATSDSVAAQVRQLRGFQTAPDLFGRIEVRSITRQGFDAQPVALAGDPLSHAAAAVRGQPVPDQDDPSGPARVGVSQSGIQSAVHRCRRQDAFGRRGARHCHPLRTPACRRWTAASRQTDAATPASALWAPRSLAPTEAMTRQICPRTRSVRSGVVPFF